MTEWVHDTTTVPPAPAAASTINHDLHGSGNDKDDNSNKIRLFECGPPMDVSIATAASEHVLASETAHAVK